MKRVLLVVMVGGLGWGGVLAQASGPPATYPLVSGRNIVQSKNYYLLTLLSELPAVRTLLTADTALARLTQQKIAQLRTAPADCPADARCYTTRMKFSEADLQTVRNRLGVLYAPDNALGKLVADHLIPSGTYRLHQQLPPKDLLLEAWEQDATGVNYAISVYAEGKKPHYPAIDSISFRVANKSYGQFMATAAATIYEESRQSVLFFEPSLTAALRFLELNEREQAADYEPMMATINKAAYNRIPSIRWNDYPYTLILVPGAGPDDPAMTLSAVGMLRCRTAALRYREGLAPFLVVSGGKVHPYKTKYCEAVEMKRFLMEKLDIPENAILVDPHARHTTTNLRNTVRLLYRYGMPPGKPCLTSTSNGQSLYITNGTLESRCRQELGYVPYRNGKRLSATEAEFYPVPDALQINPLEPLDP